MKMSKSIVFIRHILVFFLLFCVTFDPGNSHFGLKNLFFLAVCSSYFVDAKKNYVPVILICFCIFFVSYAHGLIINTRFDYGIANWYLKSFFFLTILLFVLNPKLRFCYFLYYTTLFLAIYVVVLAILNFTPFYPLVVNHIKNNEDFIMYGFRSAYGIPYFCLYYRTSSLAVIPESCAFLLFIKTRKRKYLIHGILFFLELFISGARANMFSAIIILLAFIIAYNLYEKRRILFFIVTVISFLFAVIILFIFLVSEKESSNIVKLGHYRSFLYLFNAHPLRYFFIGSGAGTIMYSIGKNGNTALTELSYFELIKSYGLLPTIVLIGTFYTPILKLWANQKNRKIVRIALTISYLCFFFIAGTNPLFSGSTGFSTIICMFYLCDKNFYSEFNVLQVVRKKSFYSPLFIPILSYRGFV